MIYTLINRDKDGNIVQTISFDSVQSFTESLRASVSSSTVEYGFPISDNITTENPTYSLNTTVSAYSLFNSDKEIYWNGQDFVTSSSPEKNPHIYMRDSVKSLWENRQVVSILESEKASFELDLETKYTQLTSKYSKEYPNCVITSLEIDTSESSNGVIFLKMTIEKVDVAYVKFGQLQENQMQPPLKPHSKVVTDLGTTKTTTTDDNSSNKPDAKSVAEKSTDPQSVKKQIPDGVLSEKEKITNAIEARKMAIGLEATGANSKWEFVDVGGATKVIREEGITKSGILQNIFGGEGR